MSNTNNKKPQDSVLSYLKRNWLIIAACVLSAFVMWGLILKDENPERVKTIRDVQVVLEGEADLLSRQLVVVGDRAVVLPRLNVRVSTDLLSYSKLTERDVTASVDLRKINGAGTYELNVTATSSNGNVLKVTPDTVTVNVDRFNTKKVPVEITTINELEKGFELGEMSISKETIELEGANSIISNIVKACYEVDLSEVDSSVNESVLLSLIDKNDNPISSNEIYGEVPSVNVTIPVYSYKELEFNVKAALVNEDLLNQNYEIASLYTVPETVKVLAPDASYLDEIDKLPLNGKIDLTGAKKDITKKLTYKLSDEMWLSEELNKVEVHVVISEKRVSKTFERMEVTVKGENGKYQYGYVINAVDVTITCAVSVANEIERENIKLYASVKNITPSNEQCYAPITYEFSEGIDTEEIHVKLSYDSIKFLITNQKS